MVLLDLRNMFSSVYFNHQFVSLQFFTPNKQSNINFINHFLCIIIYHVIIELSFHPSNYFIYHPITMRQFDIWSCDTDFIYDFLYIVYRFEFFNICETFSKHCILAEHQGASRYVHLTMHDVANEYA